MVRRVKALRRVVVDGVDVTARLNPLVISLRVRDERGSSSDTAEIVLDDRGGRIALPPEGRPIRIDLGWEGEGLTPVFSGTVDEVRSRINRSEGQVLAISAKGADMKGALKQAADRHADDDTLGAVMERWGLEAGLERVTVDPDLAGIARPYWSMDGESFLAWGRRIATEVGGTFKVMGGHAVLVKTGTGRAANGKPLTAIRAVYGENLVESDIAPVLGRPRHRKTRARYYDRKAATWRSETIDIDDDGSTAVHTTRHPAADAGEASNHARSAAAAVERAKGEGGVVIVGEVAAQPEATCEVGGVRPGVDGAYTIKAVEHEQDRASGFVSHLELGKPAGTAGQDKR